MTLQAFISYKSEYRDFAERLRESMQAWGHRVWLDVFDIPAGTQPGSKGWDDAIHHGMRSSQVVIGVLTPESLKSENVLDEWGWALENNRRLFLLWLRDVNNEDIPPRYVRIQRIDLRKDAAQGFNRLQQALATPSLIAPHDDVGTRHAVSTPPTPTPKDDNRNRMIQNVRDSWIKGVLEPALQGTEFDLGMTLKPDAVLKHADFGDYALPTTAGILQVFDDLGKELLILGAPGAGKTILLLQLARELLNRAENDPRQPIPVVLNLSSWAADRKPLAEWLTERLKLEYGVPKKQATYWQENENLLLLFDGLDEVNRTYRNDCVLAINIYRQQHRNLIPIVVCSRIVDYDLLKERLNLTGALLLQALTDEQIDAQISDDDYAALRQAMITEPHLREMAKTPFLFNAMTYTYRGSTFGDLNYFPYEYQRSDHLFSRFVKARLEAQPHETYSRLQFEYWIAWLAYKMKVNSQIVFYIERIQLDWLRINTKRYKWIYRIKVRHVVGVISGLTGATLYMMLGGLLGMIVTGVSIPQMMWVTLISNHNSISKVSKKTNWAGKVRIRLVELIMIAFVGLLFIRAFMEVGWKTGWETGWETGIRVGVGKLINSSDAAIQHLILRIILTRAGYTPWNYAAFLDYCASVGILRKVGGGYIFAHRMLLEYFAGLADENQNKAQAK